MSDCRLLMISAMYENGGNVTHRFLDGHPDMFVYPFESQLGTTLVNDPLTSMFPVKYRWPVFSLSATPEEDFQSIIAMSRAGPLRKTIRNAPSAMSSAYGPPAARRVTTLPPSSAPPATHGRTSGSARARVCTWATVQSSGWMRIASTTTSRMRTSSTSSGTPGRHMRTRRSARSRCRLRIT